VTSTFARRAVLDESRVARRIGACRVADRRELEGKRSVSSDRSRWEKHIVPEIWTGLPLAEVRKRDIREWVSRLRKTCSTSGKQISAQTVLHCVKLVSACFRSAIEDELVDKNPVAGLQIDRPRPSPDMWTYLTVAEQNQLATFEVFAKTERETLLTHAERLLALIAIGTGMRQGEQWNLELRDTHVDAPEPWLFVRWGSKGKPPKNGRPRRLPLFGIGLVAMKEWLRMLPRYAPKNPHGLAFPTERGCRRQKKPPRRWARLLKSAKLHDLTIRHDRRPIRWHDLRHTCASSLVAGWWGKPWRRLEMVRDMLGTPPSPSRALRPPLSERPRRSRRSDDSPITFASASGPTHGPNLARLRSATPRNRSARHAGVEPATYGSGGRRSIQLS
jgi:integrase